MSQSNNDMQQENTHESKDHQLKGYMVRKRTEEEIASLAIGQYLLFNRKKVGLENIETVVDLLCVEQGIVVHVEGNKKWDKQHSPFKKGESKPSEKTITIPKRVYDGIKKGRARDLEVLFHEIGHVILEHSPIYMKADGYTLTAMDDAEVQADFFAAVMLRLFEIQLPIMQLELDLT